MSSNEVTWKDKLKAYTRTPGSLIVMLLVMLSAIMTFAVLIFLIVYVLAHGVPYLKPSIFSLHYTSENASLMPALINTVIMVAGNQPRMPEGIFRGVRTLTANIVIEMGYASGLHREALIATGVVLFVFILLLNFCVALLKRGKNYE